MNCDYALKYMYSEKISVKAKQQIDTHINGCSYCHGQIAESEKVGAFLENLTEGRPTVPNWLTMLREIRNMREKRQRNLWNRIADLLPLEPAYRRAVYIGVTSCIILFGVLFLSLPAFQENAQMVNSEDDDIEYYLQEHALTQDSYMFSHGAYTRTFIGLASAKDSKIKFPNYKNQ